MGRSRRKRPAYLAEKLLWIRRELALSQSQLVDRIQCDDYPLHKGDISNFESNKSEPPLTVLLRYARLVGVSVDVLIDDDLDIKGRRLGKPTKTG